MGVTGLWKLLEPSGKPVPVETLENKVLAIDISIWLHQVVKGFQDSKGGTLPNAHLLGLFHRLCKLLFYRIKPVFVFDGGAPPLKKQTLRKRQENKKQFLSSADRLQELLLQALAKEKVVQQVLGDSAPLLTKSPKKKIEEENKPSRDDMFKLPPLEESSTAVVVDDSLEEKKMSNMCLHSVDVNSAAFKALPADKRYEILTDLKETRKQSSWGRLHELPVHSNDFASFQMERLLKRRQIQVSLEEAEKDMGGATLSFYELEKMLTEEGVLAAASREHGQRIANDNVTKFVFVKDLKKALEDAKKIESDCGESSSGAPSAAYNELGTEFENDLQKAIAMSLEEEPDDEEEIPETVVKMSEEQKKFLKGAAKSLARAYMMEFGGMSSEDVEDLFKETEEDVSNESPKTTYFDVPEEKLETAVQVISSDSDSDFEEVPMVEKKGLEVVINPSEIRESLENDLFSDIFAKEDQIKEFEKPSTASSPAENSQEILIKSVQKVVATEALRKEVETEANVMATAAQTILKTKETIKDVAKDEHLESKGSHFSSTIPQGTTNSEVSAKSISPSQSDEVVPEAVEPEKCNKVIDGTQKSILEELMQQKNAIPTITLEDLSVNLKNPTTSSVIEISDTDEDKTPTKVKKSLDDYFQVTPGKKKEEKKEEDIPKVPSPFFVKKSPEKFTPKKATRELFPEDKIMENQESFIKILEEKDREKLQEIKTDLAKEKNELEREKNKQERLAVSITDKMSSECKELLKLFGIPYIIAPMEAEAQCAFMNAIQLTDGTITDDSDIWLFGGQTVYKNFFDQRKHVLEYRMEKIEKLFRVDRTKLIQMAMLVGSDYTIGINGIGAVTALEILAQFPATSTGDSDTALISGLKSFKEWWHGSRHTSTKRSVLKGKLNNIVLTDGFPSINVLRAYLYPDVDDSQEAFVWGSPDVESIREFTKKKFGWTSNRTDELLDPVLKKLSDRKVQSSIKNYFKILTPCHPTDMKVSKRVRKAIDHMAGETSATPQKDEESPKKKTRKGGCKKQSEKKDLDGDKSEKKSAPKRRSNSPIPSTSKAAFEKIPRIPNTKTAIPQRVKDEKEAQEKMKKAIEVFKKKPN
ncbi:DNA excision repair protein ERCC-5 homolog isoform X2 [Lutzomyia longipalpis]|uniref:DNA excision repair protein ERCC-5 homolog isoform X2 n=1 Tax=Lutzomyia longipalpis TaxID=7200 RepID=UPI00248395E9|nr:DNA excision repair protein ERCC-5 homolog isoform X2 [Lutzomyia longipalpis]